MIKLSTITPNPDNPRFIKDEAFTKLRAKIEKFPKALAYRPIVVTKDGIILGGNMRYNALIDLGYTEVPDEWIRRAEDLTEEEAREFILLDNASFGSWDYDALANEWKEEELDGWDIPGATWDESEDKDEAPAKSKASQDDEGDALLTEALDTLTEKYEQLTAAYEDLLEAYIDQLGLQIAKEDAKSAWTKRLSEINANN